MCARCRIIVKMYTVTYIWTTAQLKRSSCYYKYNNRSVVYTLIKKKITFSSYIRKFKMVQLQSHI
jgi:hypothetical protein